MAAIRITGLRHTQRLFPLQSVRHHVIRPCYILTKTNEPIQLSSADPSPRKNLIQIQVFQNRVTFQTSLGPSTTKKSAGLSDEKPNHDGKTHSKIHCANPYHIHVTLVFQSADEWFSHGEIPVAQTEDERPGDRELAGGHGLADSGPQRIASWKSLVCVNMCELLI